MSKQFNTTIIDSSTYYSHVMSNPLPQLQCLAQSPEFLPQRANPTDAGADLKSAETVEIYPGEQRLVDCGVAVKIPKNYAGFVIDSDYRGNIKVILRNLSEDPYKIEVGDRIAQLVIMPILLCNFVDTWNDTARGTGGFGSTGT